MTALAHPLQDLLAAFEALEQRLAAGDLIGAGRAADFLEQARTACETQGLTLDPQSLARARELETRCGHLAARASEKLTMELRAAGQSLRARRAYEE